MNHRFVAALAAGLWLAAALAATAQSAAQTSQAVAARTSRPIAAQTGAQAAAHPLPAWARDASWAVRERDPAFWPRLRAALERIDPDLLLIAEGSATDPYYLGHGFDAAYDWTARIGQWAWSGVFDRGDTSRRANAAIPDLARLRAALLDTAMLLTLPGLPLIYDGDEVRAAFQPYDGRPIERIDRYGLRAFYERLGRLGRTTPALRSSTIHLVATDHDRTVLAYLRPAPESPCPRGHSNGGLSPGGPPQTDSCGVVLVLTNWADAAVDVRIADAAALRAFGADEAAVDLLSRASVFFARDHGDTSAFDIHLPAHGALILTRRSSRIP